VHQPLDIIEHVVDDMNEPIQIATSPAGRQSLGEVAVDDAFDGAEPRNPRLLWTAPKSVSRLPVQGGRLIAS
jgi:hypothetical protein